MSLSIIRLSTLWPYGIVFFLEIINIFREKTFKDLINKYTICLYGAISILIIKQLLLYRIDKAAIYFILQLLFGVPFAFFLITYCFYRGLPLFLSLFPKGKSHTAYLAIQQSLKKPHSMFCFIAICTLIYNVPYLFVLITYLSATFLIKP